MLLSFYKPTGATPLEIVKKVRQKFPEYKNEKIGYAGRLDPLAQGVVLLMIGEDTTKNREQHLKLPKVYEFEAVFGVATDTYDALGLLQPKNCHPELVSGSSEMLNQVQHDIQDLIKSKKGKQLQTYPPFSSKTVNGKPLFWYAKENKLSEIEIPVKEIEIYAFQLIKLNTISAEKLEQQIMKQIDSVKGDFRQKEIKETWKNFFAKKVPSGTFQTARFQISCSSGTYVRSLINDLGEKLGTGAIALEILRTKVGTYDLHSAIKL